MGTVLQNRNASVSRLAGLDSLAQELHVPVEQVQRAYLAEVSRLEADARIKTFVSVIAFGTVRSELRRKQQLDK